MLRFWSCCIFLWRSRLTNWSKAKGSIPDHDPLTTNIVSVSSSSESSKKTAITLCVFCPSHDFVQHNTASLEQLLGLCLYLVYPSGPAPAAFAYSRIQPCNWTRYGPCSHSAGISIDVPSNPSSIHHLRWFPLCFLSASVSPAERFAALTLNRNHLSSGRQVSKCKW